MQILNNPWFIGIGGGILSGFVVTVITRYLFSRRDNREYAQKVVTANQEIIYAVRPGISEGVIPDVNVLNSLIRATSGKYRVDAKDLYLPRDIADVLTKEVMDTSFLSASTKAEFCEKLTNLQEPSDQIQMVSTETPSRGKTVSELSEYRKRMVQMMSVMLGFVAATMTAAISFLSEFKNIKTDVFSKDFTILMPTILTLVVAVMATYSVLLIRTLERKKKKTSESKETEKD